MAAFWLEAEFPFGCSQSLLPTEAVRKLFYYFCQWGIVPQKPIFSQWFALLARLMANKSGKPVAIYHSDF
jgi:hypothetical protein